MRHAGFASPDGAAESQSLSRRGQTARDRLGWTGGERPPAQVCVRTGEVLHKEGPRLRSSGPAVLGTRQ